MPANECPFLDLDHIFRIKMSMFSDNSKSCAFIELKESCDFLLIGMSCFRAAFKKLRQSSLAHQEQTIIFFVDMEAKKAAVVLI